jgi:HEAT repeat protein
MRTRLLMVVGLLLCAAAGCGGANDAAVRSALERGKLQQAVSAYDALGQPDTALLRRIAAALLKEEALGKEAASRDAALAGLALAGSRGRKVLRELGQSAGETGERAVVGAKALGGLAALGDQEAASRLRELVDSEQPEIRAAAVSVLRPESDLKRLLAALESPYLAVRLAAAHAFGSGPGNDPGRIPPPFSSRPPLAPEARIALERAARHDPGPAVRSAALWSLASAGSQAAQSIEDALANEERTVRLAAIGALGRADSARARLVLGRLLESDLGEDGITAARHLLAQGSGGETDDRSADAKKTAGKARDYLHRALSATDPALRALAAVALDALDESLIDIGRVLERIEQERVPRVRLSLVSALRQSAAGHRKRLNAALREIGASGGVTGAYAIADLARQGERKAIQKLLSLLGDDAVAVKRVAVRAVARDLDRPHEVRQALADPDPLVRIAAAGAILASNA